MFLSRGDLANARFVAGRVLKGTRRDPKKSKPDCCVRNLFPKSKNNKIETSYGLVVNVHIFARDTCIISTCGNV